jgi:hypothetical protein
MKMRISNKKHICQLGDKKTSISNGTQNTKTSFPNATQKLHSPMENKNIIPQWNTKTSFPNRTQKHHSTMEHKNIKYR